MMNSRVSSARPHRWRVEPTCGLARRHWVVGVSPILRSSSSTFLRPFAPDPLRPFVALMDALTPARSVQAVLGLFPAATLWAPREQVSLIHAPDPPTIPSPTTGGRSASSGHVTHRRVEPRLLPHGTSPNGNSGLRHWLAGSPPLTGRIEFLIVRTSRSPPAAPHPVSPRRSCRRLQVTSTWRGLSPLLPGALSGALAPGLPRHVAASRYDRDEFRHLHVELIVGAVVKLEVLPSGGRADSPHGADGLSSTYEKTLRRSQTSKSRSLRQPPLRYYALASVATRVVRSALKTWKGECCAPGSKGRNSYLPGSSMVPEIIVGPPSVTDICLAK